MAQLLALTDARLSALLIFGAAVFASLMTYLGVRVTKDSHHQDTDVSAAVNAATFMIDGFTARLDTLEQEIGEWKQRAKECEDRERRHLRDHHGILSDE